MAFSLLLLLSFFVISFGYDVEFTGIEITFYDGPIIKPYSIKMLGSNYMLVCFEQRDVARAGDCRTGLIDGIQKQIVFSKDYIFEEIAATDPYQIQLLPSYIYGDYFIVAYTNSATSARGPGVAVMGKYNKDDGSIQYGVKTVFNPLENDQSVLVELQANGYFITCASVGPNAQYETACRIGNYTTDSLRLQYSQNYYNITSEVRTDGMGIVRINSNNFVVCYGRGIAETGVCVIGRVVNNFGNGVDSQIVYSNEIVFNSEGGTRGVKIKVVNAQVDGTVFFVLCYESRNDGACSVGTARPIDAVSFTMEILGRYPFGTDIAGEPDMFVIPDGQIDLGNQYPQIVVCYVGDMAECKVGEYNEVGKSIYFEPDTFNFSASNTGAIDLVYLGDNQMMICYVKFSGSTPFFNKGVCQFGTVVKPVRSQYNYTYN